MHEILIMIKNVAVFLLAASLLTNLFAGTEYRKYFLYAVGLMVIALVMAPVLSFLRETPDFEELFYRASSREQAEEMEERIGILEQERENYLIDGAPEKGEG